MLHRPYLVFVATFTVVFITAFSFIGNFGILTRQRTQLLPLVFVFLAMPPMARRRGLVASGHDEQSELGELTEEPSGTHEPVGTSASR